MFNELDQVQCVPTLYEGCHTRHFIPVDSLLADPIDYAMSMSTLWSRLGKQPSMSPAGTLLALGMIYFNAKVQAILLI